jgi:ribonuclease HII
MTTPLKAPKPAPKTRKAPQKATQPAGPCMKLETACGQGPVCGVDEAGRGPWAGPVSAAAVILPAQGWPDGINDSKELNAKAREALELQIKACAIAWGVGFASVEEIAELNILHATGLAMRRAVEAMAVPPAVALVDGNYAFSLPCEVRTVVEGDAISLSIAAASILAKTARDRLMVEADGLYPGYGFAKHKGYNAPIHLEALRKLGPCPIHRRAWAPVKAVLAGEAVVIEVEALD